LFCLGTIVFPSIAAFRINIIATRHGVIQINLHGA
jgi:hypothetical protein